MEPLDIAIPVASAFAVAAVTTPFVGRFARAIGAIDRPSDRGVNQRPDMPLCGGLAVAGAFAVGLYAALELSEHGPDPRVRGLLLGGLVMLATGMYDDRFGMNAWQKLSGQVLAAGIAISQGFRFPYFTNPFTQGLVDVPEGLVWAVTLVWIVGITNALNLLDGLDGLAAGVSAIIAATLAAIAFQGDQTFVLLAGVALTGALLGFLPHNFSPARIFLGDTGALFVGYTLSLLALECYRRVSLITLIVPMLALAVPILDTLMSIVRRIVQHKPIFKADRQHMHHRLLAYEGSPRAAVTQFYLLTSAFCMIAVSFTRLQGITAAVFLVTVLALTVRLLWNLGVIGRTADEDAPAQDPTSAQRHTEGGAS
ncbi:MAG TPA: MraY family glycosyltransferase [Myxococcota bacterium]|nr:MraY family glycosyltransferase [Myxococcota bacterium]